MHTYPRILILLLLSLYTGITCFVQVKKTGRFTLESTISGAPESAWVKLVDGLSQILLDYAKLVQGKWLEARIKDEPSLL